MDYLNDIRDAQMLYLAPRLQFEKFDPLDYYNENEFMERFRFTKTEIRRLEGLIRHRQEAEYVNRGTNITPMEQLLVTMQYLATGCFQRVTADFVGVSTSSANNIIHRVSNIIASSHKENINFPRTEVDISPTKQNFYAYCQFPGIIGSIDSMHVPIQNPSGGFAEI